MKRVSDEVKNYKDWQQGDIITITAGTGAGKSYFVKNKLYEHAKQNNKRILLLVHRVNCRDQFRYEIKRDNKQDTITVATYQSIESSSKRGLKSNENHPADFDYVICDEFHYFMSDASFNNSTDLSLDTILEATDSIRVFMSATGDYVERYLKNHKKLEVKPYTIDINFDFIKSLSFYKNKETVERYIKLAIEGNHKSIFFINDVEYAAYLHEKYKKYSMFNCSKMQKEYKLADEKKIENMLKNERFEDLILFTTSVMDTGVNIVDTEIKNIVCHNILDVRVLTQCIGRKRFKDDKDRQEGINLVVSAFTNRQLNGHNSDFKQQINHADYLLKHGTSEYNNKYFRDSDKTNITYDDATQTTRDTGEVVKKVNELAYFTRKISIVEINQMIELGKNGYCKYIKQWLDFKGNYIIREDEQHKVSLEDYLDSVVGVAMLQVKDRKELIEMMDVRDGNNRLLRSIKTLNGMLKENNYDFIIDEFRTSRQVNGKRKYYKSAWRIRRLSDK